MGKIGMSWVGRGLSKWGRQVLGEPEQGRFLLVDFELKEGFWNSKDKLLAHIKTKEIIFQRRSNFRMFDTSYHVPWLITCKAKQSSTQLQPLLSHPTQSRPSQWLNATNPPNSHQDPPHDIPQENPKPHSRRLQLAMFCPLENRLSSTGNDVR